MSAETSIWIDFSAWDLGAPCQNVATDRVADVVAGGAVATGLAAAAAGAAAKDARKSSIFAADSRVTVVVAASDAAETVLEIAVTDLSGLWRHLSWATASPTPPRQGWSGAAAHGCLAD